MWRQDLATIKAREQRHLDAARAGTVPAGLLDEYQIAVMFDVSIKTVRGWRDRGLGPPYLKLVHRIRYEPDAVADWLEGCRRTPGGLAPGPAPDRCAAEKVNILEIAN